jgi:spore coat assembly protein SafA
LTASWGLSLIRIGISLIDRMRLQIYIGIMVEHNQPRKRSSNALIGLFIILILVGCGLTALADPNGQLVVPVSDDHLPQIEVQQDLFVEEPILVEGPLITEPVLLPETGAAPIPYVIVHVVQPGETIQDIALQYGVTPDQVFEPWQVDSSFVPGQNVVAFEADNDPVQPLVVADPPPPPVQTFVVIDPQPVEVQVIPFTGGQEEVVVVPNTGIQPQYYIVQRGDTLASIARRFGLDLNILIQANPQFSNPNLIYPGQAVWMPPW